MTRWHGERRRWDYVRMGKDRLGCRREEYVETKGTKIRQGRGKRRSKVIWEKKRERQWQKESELDDLQIHLDTLAGAVLSFPPAQHLALLSQLLLLYVLQQPTHINTHSTTTSRFWGSLTSTRSRVVHKHSLHLKTIISIYLINCYVMALWLWLVWNG